MSHSLQDTFDLRGRFWLPDNPSDKVTGTVRYTPRRMELELTGPLLRGDAPVERADAIVGVTQEGDCTLRGAVHVESKIAFAGGSELHETLWRPTLLVTGASYARSEELLVEGCAFGFDLLEPWLATPAFDVSFGATEGHPAMAVQRRDPAVKGDLDESGAQFTLSSAWSFGGDFFRTLQWQRHAAVTLWAPGPAELDWFLGRLGDLRALLSLFVGEPVVPIRAAALVDGGAHEFGVFFSVVGGDISLQVSPQQMVLTHPTIGDRIESVVQAWFAKRDDLRPTVSLLFGTLYLGDALPPEFRFLALTQALETFHRRRYGGAYMTPEDYERIRKELVQAISEDIANDHRDALKSRLKYGNEFSQRRRFRDLMKTLDGTAVEASVQTEAFLDHVVAHRNYLTHYPAGEAPPMTATESVYAAFRLRAFLWFLLLDEVGLTGSEVVEGVRRTQWHRGFVG